jgi:hypothetical protein
MKVDCMKIRLTSYGLILLTGLLTGGCAMFSGPDPEMRVSDTQLNRLEIQYLPGRGERLVRLSILGTGYLQIQRGASPLVTNDFSQNTLSSQWSDHQVDQISLQPSESLMIFQTFVDRGLFRKPDPAFQPAVDRGGAMAIISGTLNNEAVARQAIEPELLGYIRYLITIFDETKKAAARTR